MYLLYSLLTAAGMILLLPYFFVQGLRRGKYVHNVRERLGHLPEEFPRNSGGKGAIWVHAVSVGEALAGVPLARRLKEKFPDRRLYVSTTTATGQALARERMGFADGFFYFPLDWKGPIRRVFDAVRPALVVVLETEIWPNFLRECRAAGVPVVFVNGRISDRSYRRYRLLNGFLARVLRDAELFLMQSEKDALRIGTLGAPAERVVIGGNLKYDVTPPTTSPFATWLEEQITLQNRRPLIVAGSVLQDEEVSVLEAFGEVVKQVSSRALLVLAPRKPERFPEAVQAATELGKTVVQRSKLNLNASLEESTSVIVLDTLGELAALYRVADVVFVGGSLYSGGGHNILEPAYFGKVPVFGYSMENFREVAKSFLSAGAAEQVIDATELGIVWVDLLRDSGKREQMGHAARKLVAANQGATDRAIERIAAILEHAGTRK